MPGPPRGKAFRSKIGCLTCRARHVKCDEGRPICATCRKSRLRCRQPSVIHSFTLCPDLNVGDEDESPAAAGMSNEHPALFDHLNGWWLNASELVRFGPTRSLQSQSAMRTHQATTATAIRPNLTNLEIFPVSSTTSGSYLPALDQILLPAADKLNPALLKEMKASTETPGLQPALIDSDIAYLLRTYKTGIGTWMDVFDCSLSYQQDLLYLASSSPLLLNSTCALAARQLSLISSAQTWTPVAEQYYGNSLGLLRSSLNDPAMDPEHAMIATILLSSYELLAFPGHNYHRHFRGAKSLVEALHAHESSKRLTRASFWIYARHEVSEALNIERSTMQDPKLWPKADFSEATIASEDIYCNDALRLGGEVICFIFGSQDKRQGKKWAKEWSGLHLDLDDWISAIPKVFSGNEYNDNGSRRYWFPRPAFGGAMCVYHVSRILLFLHCPQAILLTMNQPNDPEEQIQDHAKQLIDIALSNMPDGVAVMMVQPVYHAARWVNDSVRREEAIVLLEHIQAKTGFHTETKVQLLKSLRASSC